MSFRSNIFAYLTLFLAVSNGFVASVQARERDCQKRCFKQTLCRIEEDLEKLSPCGTVTPISQADIDTNGYLIFDSGFYCLTEDIVFDGDNATNAGALGPMCIAINANNVDLNLNEHTITLLGEGCNGVSTIGTSSHVNIHNGSVLSGDGNYFQTGLLVLGNDVTLSDIYAANFSGIFGAGVVGTGYYLPAVSSFSSLIVPSSGLEVVGCEFSNNYAGVALLAPVNGAIVRDCVFEGNLGGIISPGDSPNVNNVLIENCSIDSSAWHGIYTTIVQNNWIIRNCRISNTGLTGMILAGCENLIVTGCQIYNSGANGIDLSIRLNNNVEISDCQVLNSGGCALRADNTENLTISDCEFTNYTVTSTPVVKIQDIYNGSIRNCYVNSLANLADGVVLRNCHGLTMEDCGVNVVCTTTQTVAPVGINLLGSVEGIVLRNCNVSGRPSIGINVGIDPLNLNNQGVIIENCVVQGATQQGINLLEAVSCAVYDSNVFENAMDGIVTDSCLQCVLRNNTVINNDGNGINNMANSVGTQIYHNFANNNGTNYVGAPLVTPYGSLTNTTGWFVNVSE